MATGWSDLSPLGQAGIISQGFGTIGGMVGSYYAAKSEQNKTRSLALQYQHKKDMVYNHEYFINDFYHNVYNNHLEFLNGWVK